MSSSGSALQADAPPISNPGMEDLTVLITTSPTPSNPSLDLLEYVIGSFSCVKGLSLCKKIIVCDGCKVRCRFSGDESGSLWRAGQVTEEALAKYEEYKQALKERVEKAENGDAFFNTEILELEERQGFGFAVKEGLKSVGTRFTMVVQHDRNFTRGPDVPALLEAMRQDSDMMKCVCLACAPLLDYPHRMKSRFRVDITPFKKMLRNGDMIVPMLQWLDSTHVAETEWYRSFVFDPARKLVKKGGFIEDKFGQEQVRQVREKGFPDGWTPFKNWLYREPLWEASGYVAHIDGRSIKNAEDLEKLQKHGGSGGQPDDPSAA